MSPAAPATATGKAAPLRVAYVLQYFPRLTETFVADEIRWMRARGNDVRIVSLLPPGREPVSPTSAQLLECTWYAPGPLSIRLWIDQAACLLSAPVTYVGLLVRLLAQPYPAHALSLFGKRLLIFWKAVSAARYLRTEEPDHIHAHFAWLPAAAAWVSARLLHKPFTVTVHAYDLYSTKSDLVKLIAGEAAHIVAISDFNRRHLIERVPDAAERVSVIHCGVDLKNAQITRPRAAARASSPLRLLSIGSLTEKKGHRYLIEACRILRMGGLDFTCTIAGGGPEEAALRRQIEAARLTGQVELLGARTHDEALRLYPEHDAFVLGSVVTPEGDRDGIPVVLIEAALAGLPIVTTSVSGIPELVVDGRTGWLVPPGNARALASAILDMASDAESRARMAANGRMLVQEQFDIRQTTAQLEAVMRKACQEPAAQQSV